MVQNHQTWHDGTLAQNLSKAIKSFMTSLLFRVHHVIKQFLLSFEVEIRDPLSFVQFGSNLDMCQFLDADLEFELVNGI